MALLAQRQLHQLDALVVHDGVHHLAIVRVDTARHEDALRLGFAVGAHRHQHRLGQRRGAVVERGVGDIHRRQPGDHGLKLIHQLQRALACLRLIRGVGGVELATGDDLPHRRRDVMLIGTGADEAERLPIFGGALLHQPCDGHLPHPCGHIIQSAGAQLLRDLVEQRVDAVDTNGRQHRFDIIFGMGDKGHCLHSLGDG